MNKYKAVLEAVTKLTKEQEKAQLLELLMEDADFIKAAQDANEDHLNIPLMAFLDMVYREEVVPYLARPYQDVAYVIIGHKLIDLNDMYDMFVEYLGESVASDFRQHTPPGEKYQEDISWINENTKEKYNGKN